MHRNPRKPKMGEGLMKRFQPNDPNGPRAPAHLRGPGMGPAGARRDGPEAPLSPDEAPCEICAPNPCNCPAEESEQMEDRRRYTPGNPGWDVNLIEGLLHSERRRLLGEGDEFSGRILNDDDDEAEFEAEDEYEEDGGEEEEGPEDEGEEDEGGEEEEDEGGEEAPEDSGEEAEEGPVGGAGADVPPEIRSAFQDISTAVEKIESWLGDGEAALDAMDDDALALEGDPLMGEPGAPDELDVEVDDIGAPPMGGMGGQMGDGMGEFGSEPDMGGFGSEPEEEMDEMGPPMRRGRPPMRGPREGA